MKLGIFLDSKLGDGGGYDQALNSIIAFKDNVIGSKELLIFTSYKENLPSLKSLNLSAEYYKLSLADHLFIALSQFYFFQFLVKKVRLKSRLEKLFIKRTIRLVYFVTPSKAPLALSTLSYLYTVWDLCHLDFPEFSEVSDYKEFDVREWKNSTILPRAICTICDSEITKKKLVIKYGVDEKRVLVIPFSPSIKVTRAKNIGLKISERANKGNYLLYPAQYWSHKNHFVILKALVLLLKENKLENSVVFTGKDYGSKGKIKKFCELNKLEPYVQVKEFVSDTQLNKLYRDAWAIIMPSYFGPTNLPPLEALFFQKPLIYTRGMDFEPRAHIGIDPDDPQSVADAILVLQDKKIRNKIVIEGNRYFRYLFKGKVEAEKSLKKIVDTFFDRKFPEETHFEKK